MLVVIANNYLRLQKQYVFVLHTCICATHLTIPRLHLPDLTEFTPHTQQDCILLLSQIVVKSQRRGARMHFVRF